MNRSPIPRRQVLAAIGLLATGGCLAQLSPGSESGIQLGNLRIANTTDDSRTVDARIERNSDTVYHDTTEIPGNDEVWIEPTWSSDPATYDFYYVISGLDEVQHGRLADEHDEETDGECMFADLWIVDGSEDSILSAKDVAEQENATCNS